MTSRVDSFFPNRRALSFRDTLVLCVDESLRTLSLRHILLSKHKYRWVLDEDLVHVFKCTPRCLRVYGENNWEEHIADDGEDYSGEFSVSTLAAIILREIGKG